MGAIMSFSSQVIRRANRAAHNVIQCNCCGENTHKKMLSNISLFVSSVVLIRTICVKAHLYRLGFCGGFTPNFQCCLPSRVLKVSFCLFVKKEGAEPFIKSNKQPVDPFDTVLLQGKTNKQTPFPFPLLTHTSTHAHAPTHTHQRPGRIWDTPGLQSAC